MALRIIARVDSAAAIRQCFINRDRLIDALDYAVEYTTMEAINASRSMAPVDTSLLRNSILMLPQETQPMRRAYGSAVPYARKQEYEHKSKAGYFRKAVWDARTQLRRRIEEAIRQLG